MNDEKRIMLIIASHVLGYPSNQFIEETEALEDLMVDDMNHSQMQEKLKKSYTPLFHLTTQERQELYVQTFDLKEKLGLYLTAHELGDSNKRGAALIKLQKMINLDGFERVDGELADYIPMLFEYLAVSTEENERLYKRLAVAIQRILNHIDKDNPYHGIFHVLMEHVFPDPTTEEVEALEFNREEADLEEMPYPIMYQ